MIKTHKHPILWAASLSTAAFLLVNIASASAATYYSSPSGLGTTCSLVSPCSYSTGLSKLVSGDTLVLGAGTYNMGINGDLIPSGTSWTSTTKIIGAGMSSTKIVPSGVHGINFATNKQYIEFSDFEIDAINANNNGINIDNGNHIRFSRLNIHHAPNQNILTQDIANYLEFIQIDTHHAAIPMGTCFKAGGYCHGFYIHNTPNVLVDRSVAWANDGNAGQFYGINAVIKNSIAYSNTNEGFIILASGAKVYNNTAYNNVQRGLPTTQGGDFRNNISVNNGNGNFSGFATYLNNLCNVSGTGCTLVGDPKFVNAGATDFHIQSSSPAINAGITLSEVTTDYDGVTRPQGSAHDIGAYEYGGTVTPPPPPTPPPVPTVSLTADPTSITSGQSSTLSWSSTNATSCTASGGWSGTRAISGSQVVTPTTNTTYTLSCTGAGGSTSQSATVTVSAPPSGTNLVSSLTRIADSNNFAIDHPVTHLWDGCTDGTPLCTTGNSGIGSFWVEFDFGKLYDLSTARLFGDGDGSWWSSSWTLQYKQNLTDAYQTAFSDQNAQGNQWFEQALTGRQARYARITVNGGTGGTQARELEIYGTESATPPSSTKFSLNDRVQVTGTGGTGINVRTCAGTSCPQVILGQTQQDGALGSVTAVSGQPTYADGFWWWNINYDSGADGWSVEEYLQKYTASPPPPPPPPPSLFCSTIGSNAFYGCYYDNVDFTNLKVTRTDSALNFDWLSGSPDPLIGPDTFSAKWEGDFNFSTAGTYRFTATADDGIRVYVDGVLQINSWIDQPPTTYAKDVFLTLGTHRVKVEYYENAGGAVAKLSWALQTTTPPPPPTDITLPVTSVTSPLAGTLVAGTVPVSASASDNVGVTKVEFYVDGNIKSTGISSPYSFSWDTTNGGTHACIGAHTHILTSKAYDAALNIGTNAGVTVNMNNPDYCAVPPPSPTPTPPPSFPPLPPLDTTPPIISSVTTSGVASWKATINWLTDEPSDSQVLFGASPTSLTNSLSSPSMITAHSITLENLAKKTTYYFKVRSKDTALNTGESQTYSFTTKTGQKIGQLVASSGSIILSWSYINDDPAFIFKRTLIWRSEDGFLSEPAPDSPSLIAALTNQSIASYTDLTAKPGRTYYYTLFTEDQSGAWSDPATISYAMRGRTTQFTRNLSLGSQGEDVRSLQVFLNTHVYLIATTGPGRPGQESDFFGRMTQLALIKFQEANRARILTPNGLARGNGFFGASTREAVNSILNGEESWTQTEITKDFAIGSRVQVSAGPLNVRSSPSYSAPILGTQGLTSQGKIIGGPAMSGESKWWQINYDRNPDGWSVENWLASL